MADESLEGESSKPGRACEGSRQDLIKCLKESDCVKVVKYEDMGWGVVGRGEHLMCMCMCAAIALCHAITSASSTCMYIC